MKDKPTRSLLHYMYPEHHPIRNLMSELEVKIRSTYVIKNQG